MKTKLVKGKDLKPGDKVIREEDGKVMTIRELTKGFARNSRVAYCGRGKNNWTLVLNSDKYEVVADDSTEVRNDN